MALLPYWFEDFRPRRLHDQLFDLDPSPEDFLLDIVERSRQPTRKYLRPWRALGAIAKDVGSIIKCDKDKFQVNLDVQHFDPEEISVKTADGYVVVEGKHEEKKDEHGYVSRQFKRRYALPEDCNPESVESKLSSDGVLTVSAPRTRSGSDERAVPITHTGPVRRKPCDDQLNGNDEEHVEAKSPEKKRRK